MQGNSDIQELHFELDQLRLELEQLRVIFDPSIEHVHTSTDSLSLSSETACEPNYKQKRIESKYGIPINPLKIENAEHVFRLCSVLRSAHKATVSCMAISEDASTVIAGSTYDCQCSVSDARCGKTRWNLKPAHHDWVWHVALCEYDPRIAASASDDRTIRIWDTVKGECLQVIPAFATCLAFAPEGFVNDLSMQKERNGKLGSTAAPLLAVGSLDGTVSLYNTETGKSELLLPGHTGGVTHLLFCEKHPGMLLTASKDRTAAIWRIQENHGKHDESGAIQHPSENMKTCDSSLSSSWNKNSVLALSKSPNLSRSPIYSYFPFASVFGRLRVHSVSRLIGHSLEITRLACSPNGQLLATASKDRSVLVWHIETGELLLVLAGGHKDQVMNIQFSPDSQLLASSSKDRKVIAWDLVSGAMKYVLAGHRNRVDALAFHPDPTQPYLVSGSHDGSVLVWDYRRGVCLQALNIHEEHVIHVAFSKDGRLLLCSSADKTISVWALDIQSLKQRARYALQVQLEQRCAKHQNTPLELDILASEMEQMVEFLVPTMMAADSCDEPELVASCAFELAKVFWDDSEWQQPKPVDGEVAGGDETSKTSLLKKPASIAENSNAKNEWELERQRIRDQWELDVRSCLSSDLFQQVQQWKECMHQK